MMSVEGLVESATARFEPFAFLWNKSRKVEFEKIKASNPSIYDYAEQLKGFLEVTKTLHELPDQLEASVVQLSTSALRSKLIADCELWKLEFAGDLRTKVKSELELLYRDLRQWEKRLSLEITDLDTVCEILESIREFRDTECDVDLRLRSVDNSCEVLVTSAIQLERSELELLEGLPHKWASIRQLEHELRRNVFSHKDKYYQDMVDLEAVLRQRAEQASEEYRRCPPHSLKKMEEND